MTRGVGITEIIDGLLGSEVMSRVGRSALQTQLILLPEDVPGFHQGAFPEGKYDEYQQQLDMRHRNSWISRPEELEPVEVGETLLVNALAPLLILQGLLPLLRIGATNSDNGHAHVVMVSAMEGIFNRHRKDITHVHTNMAKAAMNMITRTCAEFYSQQRILINSVDTGWIDDMTPLGMPGRRGSRHIPPLADADGAARILDPVFQSVNHGISHHGVFFKDYHPSQW